MKNRFLLLIDGSYFLYYTAFSAVRKFQQEYPVEANQWIKPIDETDQDNLPNLLNCETFRKVIKNKTMQSLESVDWLVKECAGQSLDFADSCEIFFTCETKYRKSFRKDLYPGYKQQRRIQKRQYNVNVLLDHILNVLFPEFEVESKYKYHILSCDGAEGDDIVACILKDHKTRYFDGLVISSDRDFLQIDAFKQVDLFGKEVKRECGGVELNAKEFLLTKILLGDRSDNIPNVFAGIGEKRVLKLLGDKTKLKEMLKENKTSLEQYTLNRKLISFDYIPQELRKAINDKLNFIYEKIGDVEEKTSFDIRSSMMEL